MILTFWVMPALTMFLIFSITSRLEGSPISEWDNESLTGIVLLSIVWPIGLAVFIFYLLHRLFISSD